MSTAPTARGATGSACDVVLFGHVQGVGFRPHVYRAATDLALTGWVQNRMGEVVVHVEGRETAIQAFLRDVIDRAPPLSAPVLGAVRDTAPEGFGSFSIRDSERGETASIFVPVDTSVCDDCLREMRDPDDRRYRYPFINCTQCGPRYTLIEAMPYDRPNTSMAGFPLCPACRAEYEDPLDRRFHAEPVACPECGPTLCLVQDGAAPVTDTDAALSGAVRALSAGMIVAVRGIGGYHLICDARNETAVSNLRSRKHRPDKPFAIMVPQSGADGMSDVRALVDIDAEAAEALLSPRRPIVLLPRKDTADLAASVAPDCGELGVFLPYSPLHALLLDAFAGPVIATSANLGGEPVLTRPEEIETRLAGVADLCLHHDRPICRPAEDPVMRRIADRIVPLRHGRGTAPLELQLNSALAEPVLAVGAHMKTAIALGFDNRAVISPHIGEMTAPRSLEVMEQVAQSLQDLYATRAATIVCDAHPGYTTSRWAREQGLPVIPVLHHHAHASALAGEYPDATGNWLTFTWDGVGLGEDGTLWGGEAFWGAPGHWRRVASFRRFRLTGGDRAGRDPWRSAAALSWAQGQRDLFGVEGAEIAHQAWAAGFNTFETSAAGRLFDAAACLVTGMTHASYEAQAPMLLETLAGTRPGTPLALPVTEQDGIAIVDWGPLVEPLGARDRPPEQRAADFHASMAQVVVDLVARCADRFSFANIGLTGGVFQNARLVAEIRARLPRSAQGALRLHHSLPCNDASIAFGQVIEQAALTERSR